MKKTNFMAKKIFSVAFLGLLLVGAGACSQKTASVPPRDAGQAFAPDSGKSFHAAEFSQGACDRLDQLKREFAEAPEGSSDPFSLYNYVGLESGANGPVLRLGSRVAESPFLMLLLRSERIRGQLEIADLDFYDLVKVNTLKIGRCDVDAVGSWGYGCHALWRQTMVSRGCAIEQAAEAPCGQVWQAVTASQEIGRCAYVETAPPAADDAFCRASKQNFAMLTLLRAQNKISMAKNKALEERFPGLFGTPGDGSKAVLALGLSRISGWVQLGANLSPIATARTALFPTERTWSAWSRDVQQSVNAASFGFEPDRGASERVCGLILAQRTFSQLIALNGFVRPELKNGNVEPLSATRASLGDVPVPGAYLSRAESDAALAPTILTPERLSGYSPESGLVLGSSETPRLYAAPTANAETLADRLARLEGLESVFEFTSPAAAWMMAARAPYLLGDLETRTQALLPGELHALAFGHLVLNYRNLAALNLKMIKANGAMVTSTADRPAGFVLMHNLSPDMVGEMHLEDLLAFARIVVRFDEAVSALLRMDPTELRSLNSLYSEAVLTQVRESAATLRRLKLPLIVLLKRMAEYPLVVDGGVPRSLCFAKVRLNLAPDFSGQRQTPLGVCSPELKSEYERVRVLVERSVFREARP